MKERYEMTDQERYDADTAANAAQDVWDLVFNLFDGIYWSVQVSTNDAARLAQACSDIVEKTFLDEEAS